MQFIYVSEVKCWIYWHLVVRRRICNQVNTPHTQIKT